VPLPVPWRMASGQTPTPRWQSPADWAKLPRIMWMPRQLLLPFDVTPAFDPADFLAAESNQAALDWIARPADWPDRRLLLWGDPACGKTHLLRNWAAAHGAAWADAAMLRGLPDPVPPSGVAIDNADIPASEAALLHLLNTARDNAAPILLAARTPPARCPIALPDLASRLRAILAVHIDTPEPALLRALLARLLAGRQLRVPEPVQDWLLLRLPRTAAAVKEAVFRLEQTAALWDHGQMTRVRAAAILSMGDTDEDCAATAAAALAMEDLL
jgi:chromosomal replication initiation ATPase DnaA